MRSDPDVERWHIDSCVGSQLLDSGVKSGEIVVEDDDEDTAADYCIDDTEKAG